MKNQWLRSHIGSGKLCRSAVHGYHVPLELKATKYQKSAYMYMYVVAEATPKDRSSNGNCRNESIEAFIFIDTKLTKQEKQRNPISKMQVEKGQESEPVETTSRFWLFWWSWKATFGWQPACFHGSNSKPSGIVYCIQ